MAIRLRTLLATSGIRAVKYAEPALCEPAHIRSRCKILRAGGVTRDAAKVYAFMMLDYLTQLA